MYRLYFETVSNYFVISLYFVFIYEKIIKKTCPNYRQVRKWFNIKKHMVIKAQNWIKISHISDLLLKFNYKIIIKTAEVFFYG